MASSRTPRGGRQTGDDSYLRKARISGSQVPMEVSPLVSPLCKVNQSVPFSLRITTEFDLRFRTILPTLLPCGRSELTVLIFIHCCPPGILLRTSAAECGQPMAAITFFRALLAATATETFSFCLTRRDIFSKLTTHQSS